MSERKVKCMKCGNEWIFKGRTPNDPTMPFYARCWVCGKVNRIVPEIPIGR